MPSGSSKLIPEASELSSHIFCGSAGEQEFTCRVLKLKNSTMIYIGGRENEIFDELAVSMISPSGDVISTTIMGRLLGCESQQLAEKMCKRLQKQIYVSCNIPSDRFNRPFIEKHLVDEIKNHREMF
ncbi:Proteasome assembly chaperone 4 [Sergentomyia squamirostris]